jgi:hypothetical protein
MMVMGAATPVLPGSSNKVKSALGEMRVQIPPRPLCQGPALLEPEIGPEPFDPVVDPPFFDLALQLAQRTRFPLSSTA